MKPLILPEGVSDYTQILKSLRVIPTIIVTDMAHIVARHTNINYPGTFRPYDGQIADPEDLQQREDIKSGKVKVDFQFVPLAKSFDLKTYNPDNSPHPITGKISVLSVYDRLHETNFYPSA